MRIFGLRIIKSLTTALLLWVGLGVSPSSFVEASASAGSDSGSQALSVLSLNAAVSLMIYAAIHDPQPEPTNAKRLQCARRWLKRYASWPAIETFMDVAGCGLGLASYYLDFQAAVAENLNRYEECMDQIEIWEEMGTYDSSQIANLRNACQQDYMDGYIAARLTYQTEVALCAGITVTDLLDPTGAIDFLLLNPLYYPRDALIYDLIPGYPGNPNYKPRSPRWEPLWLYRGIFTEWQWEEWRRGLEACAASKPGSFTTPTVIPRWYGD